MLNYIAMYKNEHEKEFNDDFIFSKNDTPIEDFIIMAMQEFESIANITIEDIEIVYDQDEVDINQHMININFKKKNLDSIEIPKNKYIAQNRYGEIRFRIRISTNKEEKVILKRILMPIMVDGYYLNNGKKMYPIWQMADASTYTQRGKITMKSRMPIIIYCNTKRTITTDDEQNTFQVPIYSYALSSSKTSRSPALAKLKNRNKYINPLMIYFAKMGVENTLEFFGVEHIISIKESVSEYDRENNYIFELDNLFVVVDKYLFDKYEYVRSVAGMCYYLKSKDYPLTLERLYDDEYWICRIGSIGSLREPDKNILSFREKGKTTIYMIERLLDQTTINNLRLPEIYKHNIYFVLYWLITNFNELKKRDNTDIHNKRIRKNEYIVNASLGRKINENINKLVEIKSRSRMNTMSTLLELFNFNSDIIFSGLRNMSDLIKADELSNDFVYLLKTAFSSKGPNSIGEGSSRSIGTKYRDLHPSMVGKLDLNTSSISEVGLSGNFVPYVNIYDGFYFSPDKEPCSAKYNFDKALSEDEYYKYPINIGKSIEEYFNNLSMDNKFIKLLEYEKIEIVETLEPNDTGVPIKKRKAR